MMLAAPFYKQEKFLYYFAGIASLALSFIITAQDAVINTDAICYLLSAKAIGDVSVHDAMHLCGQAAWPFYSLLIYTIAHLTHFSYELSAHLLNASFSLPSVITFILIVKLLSGSSLRLMWLAAITILLSHSFNGVREYIIRDHGFWAFYLISLYAFLRYVREPRYLFALCWSSSLIVATLFRIEGAIFLVLLPTVVLINSQQSLRERLKQFFSLHTLTLLLSAVFVCYLLWHKESNLSDWGRVADLVTQLQRGLSIIAYKYQATKATLLSSVLTVDSMHDATMLTLVLFASWYAVHVFSNLSWIYAFLFAYALYHRSLRLAPASRQVIAGYIVINVIITLAFLLEHTFLSKRYLIALALIFMLWVPFALDSIWQKAKLSRQRFYFAHVLGIFIIASGVGGIVDFGYSKVYLHDAGEWLAQNVNPDKKLYSNDIQIMYYSGHFGANIFNAVHDFDNTDVIDNKKWKDYDYLALRVNKKSDSPLLTKVRGELLPCKVFYNRRGDQVAIYKVH